MTCQHNYLGESTCEHCGANESEALQAELRAARREMDRMREALEWIGSVHCALWPASERSIRFGECYDKARAALAHKEKADDSPG